MDMIKKDNHYINPGRSDFILSNYKLFSPINTGDVDTYTNFL